jgi:hypothetical protein
MAKQTIPVSEGDTLMVDQVGGDVTVQGWDRQEAQASGDVLRVEREDRSIVVSTGGDLSISVPRGMAVTLGQVGGDASLQDLAGAVELGLVGGDASLRNLSGPVQLTGMVGGHMHMDNVSNVSMGSEGRGPGFDVGERVRHRIEQATRRAERKLRRAQAKMDIRFDGGRWRYNAGSAAPSEAAGEPVSEEERMTILRMLQEKKITSEEAEKLLAALEGNA